MARDRTASKKALGLFRRGPEPPREIERSDADWREHLTADQYRVLRRKATEQAFTGEHIHPGEPGRYRCAGCDAQLFDADAQFDSGTGWPSFSEVMPGSVELKRDFRGGLPRTEALCRRCGGHLGHLFRGGPGPERSRYCINSCALTLDDDADPADHDPPL